MTTAAEYLTMLSANDICVWLEGGQLRYHAKKGALSAQELATLRTMKEAIVAQLRNASAPAPLSFQQHWLLGLMRSHEDWPQTLGFALRLRGEVETQILERALERVAACHGALRTRIVAVEANFVQQIDAAAWIPLDLVQVPGHSITEREHNLLGVIEKLTALPVDPAGPLMRASLLQLSTREPGPSGQVSAPMSVQVLVLVFSRLIADCLSVGEVLRTLWAVYGDIREGVPSGRPVAALKYHDYTLWQHATDAQWQHKHLAHWTGHLADAAPVRWPVQECPRADLNGPSRSCEISFGTVLSAGLRELARQTRSLPALVALATYVGFISQWCEQKDFIVPFLVAGRNSEYESVVGYFSHVLYLRIRLGDTETFAELLQRVSTEFYRAVFHQDFGRLAQQKPELLRGTLCQWLSWHPTEIGGLTEHEPDRRLGFARQSVRFQTPLDLTNVPPGETALEIILFEAAGDIGALALYGERQFSEATMARMMGALRRAAEQFVADPHLPVLRQALQPTGPPVTGWVA